MFKKIEIGRPIILKIKTSKTGLPITAAVESQLGPSSTRYSSGLLAEPSPLPIKKVWPNPARYSDRAWVNPGRIGLARLATLNAHRKY